MRIRAGVAADALRRRPSGRPGVDSDSMRVAGRPFGILILAVLGVAGGLWAFAGLTGFHDVPEFSIRTASVPEGLVRVAVALWATVTMVAAVLLLALDRWGWILAMLAAGLGLLASLWSWGLGHPEPVRLLILVVTAFYLNGREVRELLLGTSGQVSVVPPASPESGR